MADKETGTADRASGQDPQSSADKVLGEALEPGEQVEIFASALKREALHLFEKCKVALTDRRLIVLKPAWPWGYKVDRADPRAGCAVLKSKQKIDGSHLVIINGPDGVVGLYFSRGWRDQAAALLAALPAATETG